MKGLNGSDPYLLPVDVVASFIWAICTQNMKSEDVEEFREKLDALDNGSDASERSRLRMPARRDGESVGAYRSRNREKFIARSQALRDDESELFGDALSLVATSVGGSDSEDGLRPSTAE